MKVYLGLKSYVLCGFIFLAGIIAIFHFQVNYNQNWPFLFLGIVCIVVLFGILRQKVVFSDQQVVLKGFYSTFNICYSDIQSLAFSKKVSYGRGGRVINYTLSVDMQSRPSKQVILNLYSMKKIIKIVNKLVDYCPNAYRGLNINKIVNGEYKQIEIGEDTIPNFL